MIHETLQKDKPSGSVNRKTKYAPPDETKEKRDARTIFIGNVAPEVAVKRVSRGAFTGIFNDDILSSPWKSNYIDIYSP